MGIKVKGINRYIKSFDKTINTANLINWRCRFDGITAIFVPLSV